MTEEGNAIPNEAEIQERLDAMLMLADVLEEHTQEEPEEEDMVGWIELYKEAAATAAGSIRQMVDMTRQAIGAVRYIEVKAEERRK